MKRKSVQDFRPFVSHSHPKVAAVRGRDALQHGAASLESPIPRDAIFKPWAALYDRPFVGVTSDGVTRPGLYDLRANGAPAQSMRKAVLQLLPALNVSQLEQLVYPINAREWRRWNNTEMYAFQQGLRLDEIPPPLRQRILAVVQASLSDAGFEKTRNVMRLNHFLGELIGNTQVLNEYSYHFSLFGTVSDAEPWGWQLMGHHLALNCVVVGEQMVLSPLFMGAEPNYIDRGPQAGIRLFEDEEYRGLALLHSLSSSQRSAAILHHSTMGGDLPPGRRQIPDQLHLGGAFQDNRIIPYEGARASAFSLAQRQALLHPVAAYVEPMPLSPMKAKLQDVERHLDDTHFCWIGGTGEQDTFYYRIQSPVVLIEFDQHSGVFLSNPEPAKFHIHTIVRTPNGNDYGFDLLRLHYEQAHHPAAK